MRPDRPFDTVHLIDWDNPDNNDFALAEEVTLKGGYERRPDVVLYVNGIAVAVIELKRSSVEIADGVRQLITNQEEIFNLPFFATAQLLLAGSDSQGLRYGTVTTREEFFVDWKAAPLPDGAAVPAGAHLDRPLADLCCKARLLDLIRNMVLFDNGVKKVPRHHQFAGVKAAQERIRRREGGVIWHTQGSGKSILMVLLAKWLLEHDPAARVLIVTDRDELDKQIEGVMKNAGVVGAEFRIATDHQPRGVRHEARRRRAKASLCTDPQIRSRRPERPAPAGPWPLLRLRGRVSPHPGRRYERADEALAE